MKRVLLSVILGGILLLNTVPAQAGFFTDRKAVKAQIQYEKNCKKDIEELFAKQENYAKAYDIKGLENIYAQNFIDNDGYNKDVYFSLIQDTWDTYPDITYTTKIKDIKLNGDYATVETEEFAVATSDDMDRHIVGELNSTSKCLYHLQKAANKWKITSEQVLEEISTLKYGNARYINMTIESPKVIGANQQYTATLRVDAPENSMVVASINQEKIVNPAEKPEDHFMKLADENTLSRIFTANTDNVNEYNVASIGITDTSRTINGEIRVAMNGLAFVMTRVNVIPINNFAKVDRKTEDK